MAEEFHLFPKKRFSDRMADRVAAIGGSWTFLAFFFVFLIVWIVLNAYLLTKPWDLYPFILLNLVLSIIAASQAPIILMSQNVAARRDRRKVERDYAVNRKAEAEIQDMQKDLDEIKAMIRKLPKKK